MVGGSPQLTTLPGRYFAPCRDEPAARARFYPDLLDLLSVFLNLGKMGFLLTGEKP